MTDDDTGMPEPDRSHARERRHELGEVPPDERARLAAGFGSVLKVERGHLTQQQLADLAGLDRRSVDRLENGRRRPTTSTTWRLATALRPKATMRSVVALDERLRQAAGPSLRDYSRRPHVAREQVREQLRAEAGDGPVLGEADTSLGAAIVAELAVVRAAAAGPTGG